MHVWSCSTSCRSFSFHLSLTLSLFFPQSLWAWSTVSSWVIRNKPLSMPHSSRRINPSPPFPTFNPHYPASFFSPPVPSILNVSKQQKCQEMWLTYLNCLYCKSYEYRELLPKDSSSLWSNPRWRSSTSQTQAPLKQRKMFDRCLRQTVRPCHILTELSLSPAWWWGIWGHIRDRAGQKWTITCQT